MAEPAPRHRPRPPRSRGYPARGNGRRRLRRDPRGRGRAGVGRRLGRRAGLPAHGRVRRRPVAPHRRTPGPGSRRQCAAPGRLAGRGPGRGAGPTRSRRGSRCAAWGRSGDRPPRLVALSETADLVVVGRRSRAERPDASLGSVSFALSAHARCPVVVVQGERRLGLGQGSPVVVGVDTSRASLRAVEFAARAAAAAGVGLVVVSAWSGREVEPWLAEAWGPSAPGAGPAGEEYDRAVSNVSAALAVVARDHPEVPTSTRTPQGSPPEVLLAEATDAGLLVVGARGGGGFVGLMLGSVSRSVLRRAEPPGGGRAKPWDLSRRGPYDGPNHEEDVDDPGLPAGRPRGGPPRAA